MSRLRDESFKEPHGEARAKLREGSASGSVVSSESAGRRLLDVLWYPPTERRRIRERLANGASSSAARVSHEFSWKILFYRVSACSLVAWFGGMMSAYGVAGYVGALGITLGFLIIYICFTLGVLVMLVAPIFDWGVPKSLVVSYLVKIALLGLVLMFVPFPENLRHGWTLAGACTGVILWIVIETVSIARLRILYFDTDSEDHGR